LMVIFLRSKTENIQKEKKRDECNFMYKKKSLLAKVKFSTAVEAQNI